MKNKNIQKIGEIKYMNNWNNYHKITDNKPPRKNIIKFIEKYNNLTGNAIDLGCGSGCDTIYLIEHNWNVLSIA